MQLTHKVTPTPPLGCPCWISTPQVAQQPRQPLPQLLALPRSSTHHERAFRSCAPPTRLAAR